LEVEQKNALCKLEEDKRRLEDERQRLEEEERNTLWKLEDIERLEVEQRNALRKLEEEKETADRAEKCPPETGGR
jgi:hypothetical protein